MACSPTKRETLNVKRYPVRTGRSFMSSEESPGVWIEQNCTGRTGDPAEDSLSAYYMENPKLYKEGKGREPILKYEIN